MKYRKLLVLVLVLILTLIFVFFVDTKKTSPEISFSCESGFYDDPFYLTINSNIDGDIYYTIDGSDPDLNSQIYTSPIYIYDATSNANVYSARNDTSAGFDKDFIKKYSYDDPEYEVPNYLVDKCFIIKAFTCDDKGNKSQIVTKTYFIDYEKKDEYNDINVISIITDPNNLFDYENGIYTTGKTYEFNKNEVIGNEDTVDWMHLESNYSKNNAKKKEAYLQVFVNRELVLSQRCDINIHGGGSRSFNQKSINLYAKSNEHEPKFKYNFFGNDFYPSCVTLSNGGDDDKVKLKDYLVNIQCENSKFSTMHFEPYVLFLDGEYWGFYWMTEKYDEDYIKYYYDVSDKNTVMIKSEEVEVGNYSNLYYYYNFYRFCVLNDLSIPENFEKLESMMDIDNFVDYFASLIYVGRSGDWDHRGNVAFWRSQKLGHSQYEDCKWRWMLFDVNSYAMSENLIDYDNFSDILEDEFFASLLNNDVIRNKFIEKLKELENTKFSSKEVNKLIDKTTNIIEKQMNMSNKRFYGDKSTNYFNEGVVDLKNFFEKRTDYINKLINAIS